MALKSCYKWSHRILSLQFWEPDLEVVWKILLFYKMESMCSFHSWLSLLRHIFTGDFPLMHFSLRFLYEVCHTRVATQNMHFIAFIEMVSSDITLKLWWNCNWLQHECDKNCTVNRYKLKIAPKIYSELLSLLTVTHTGF